MGTREMTVDHDRFMAIAIQEAQKGLEKGEQPFGSVVVRDDAVVAQTHSVKVSTHDITEHAELRSVRRLTGELNFADLADCTFYTTCEPCPMCLGALFNASLNTLVLGARLRDLGQQAFRFCDYSVESFAAMTGWDLTLIEGVRRDECTRLYGSNIAVTR